MNRAVFYVLSVVVMFLLVFGNHLAEKVDNLQQAVILAKADRVVYEMWIEELRK